MSEPNRTESGNNADRPKPAVEQASAERKEEKMRILDIACAEGNEEQPPASMFQQALRSAPFCILVLFLMSFSLTVVTNRMPDPATSPQLPDMGFDLLGEKRDVAHVVDPMLTCITVGSWILVFYFAYTQYKAVKYCISKEYIPGPVSIKTVFETKYEFVDKSLENEVPYADYAAGKHWNTVLRAAVNYAVPYGLSTIGRVIACWMTSLPTPNNHCAVAKPHISDWLMNGWIGFYTFGAGSKHCGDLLYSGHSICFYISFSVFWKYGSRIHWILPYAALTWMLSGFVGILMSRSHYTNDILFAVYMTWSMRYMMPVHLPRFMVWILFPTTPNRRMQTE